MIINFEKQTATWFCRGRKIRVLGTFRYLRVTRSERKRMHLKFFNATFCSCSRASYDALYSCGWTEWNVAHAKEPDVNPEIFPRAFHRGKRMVGANYIARGPEHLTLSLITFPVSSLWNWIATHRQWAGHLFFFFLRRVKGGRGRHPLIRLTASVSNCVLPPLHSVHTLAPVIPSTTPRTRRIYAHLRHRPETREMRLWRVASAVTQEHPAVRYRENKRRTLR